MESQYIYEADLGNFGETGGDGDGQVHVQVEGHVVDSGI
jgi:hypothetical protein